MTTVNVDYQVDSEPIGFGVDRLISRLQEFEYTTTRANATKEPDHTIRIETGETETEVSDEGYEIQQDEGTTYVRALDEGGAMYGALDLAEQLSLNDGLDSVEEVTTNPEVTFRALKFNLPWSPYRGGEQTEVHYDTCRDLGFWEAFLDMMAENKFNALSLWNLHPFPYMIQPEGYPEASMFSDSEMNEWRSFWQSLFRMAHDRNIETYILNWNILYPEGFAEEHDIGVEIDSTALERRTARYTHRPVRCGLRWEDRPSDIAKEYTKQCITQVVNEYPNLDGLGVSLCDWMREMSPREKQDWFKETFIDGIDEANREVKLLDRSVRTRSIEEMRQKIDIAADVENISDIRVPTKFNWSHGHSSTSLELTHDYDSGKVDTTLWDPKPENYTIAWMIRNEDFFVLRWGDPDFVREHIAQNHTGNSTVDGYFVGSEAFIPAKDYMQKLDRHKTWNYLFEKQWLLYTVWGRLLYDPDTPDRVFENAFNERYGKDLGGKLLTVYRLGSKMPQELASFHASTWDYALYSEGFLAPVETLGGLDDGESPFISVDELIHHDTLDSAYVSIPEYVEGGDFGDEMVTPLELADKLDQNGRTALELVDELRAELSEGDGALTCEIDDGEAWAHLSRYFATKLRGAVSLELFRESGEKEEQDNAIEMLTKAKSHWDSVSTVTERNYREMPYATDQWPDETFSWTKYRDQVERDITIAIEAEQNGK